MRETRSEGLKMAFIRKLTDEKNRVKLGYIA